MNYIFYCIVILTIFCGIAKSGEILANDQITGALLPLPPAPTLDTRKVALGEKLFNDTILSGNQTMACASCHELSRGGDDHQQFSVNTLGKRRIINTPTVFNATHNFKASIAGTTDTFDEFFRVNLFGKKAMNHEWPALLESLNKSSVYPSLFADAYAAGITQDNVVDALLTFQYTLVTPDAPFDKYLLGNKTAITPQERHGYHLFQVYGCTACHQGKNIGGNLYQKLGIFEDYYPEKSTAFNTKDYGLFNKTGNEKDRFYFRVPSLRNVALTAPYLHDGSIETLDETIEIMARFQLGRTISPEDRADIAAFLSSLTGRYKGVPFDIH